MKVLVLGGTRYFGRRFVHMLIEEGHSVFVLSRGQVADDFGDHVFRLTADRNNKEALKTAVDGLKFDVIVDQVCMTAQQAMDAVEIFKDKTQYYLMTSTMSVYDLGANLTEELVNPAYYRKINPTHPMEAYADGKRAAENIFAEQNYFQWAFARFPIVLGEDDYTRRLHLHVEKVKTSQPLYFPNLDAKMGFIPSDDAAKALLWLSHNRHQGAYNFATEDVISMKSLVLLIEKETGKKAHLITQDLETARSPFGVPEDWSMSVEKAKSQGFLARPLSSWLQPLIRKISH